MVPDQNCARSEWCQIRMVPGHNGANSEWYQIIMVPGQNGARSERCQIRTETSTYTTTITFTVTALDNIRELICYYRLDSDEKRTTFTPYVILVPLDPELSGLTLVEPNTEYTWTCLSNGSSYIPPNVFLRNGNGDLIRSEKVTRIIEVPNKNSVHVVVLTARLSIPATDLSYVIRCHVVHQFMSYSQSRSAEMIIHSNDTTSVTTEESSTPSMPTTEIHEDTTTTHMGHNVSSTTNMPTSNTTTVVLRDARINSDEVNVLALTISIAVIVFVSLTVLIVVFIWKLKCK
ncbi:uncharacterized protein LOC131945207 [Physella acuta]|uniref:uncharacterized protein LOC131945207 n=1 Tax=Physella acuta TaxID=109671 RepID=UPI0027DDEC1C|nr:uncharacterized protein LOC131945207 [Physella acuta]